MMRANGRFGAHELDFEFWPQGRDMAGAWYLVSSKGISIRRWRASQSDPLAGSLKRKDNAKSSPLIKRNDAMLRARANAAGMGPARTPPLISEESEGLATLAARNADGSEEVESKISRDVTPHP